MSGEFHFADLFAGSGGTSTGAMIALARAGRVARLVAVNHWPVAVATHAANHPDGAHYCMDLETAEPEAMVPGRRLDLLVASPECTHFSRARGGKVVNDQRRAGANWVLRWLERLDVRVLLIENVEEFMSWGELNEKGLPVSKKKGSHFIAWLKRLEALGYRYEHKILNAADYGDVTTRKRFFLIARKDGRPIRWPTPTHSKLGTSDMFGTLPKWRATREIIDWSDLGASMLDREKPLSLKTRLRIARGAQRFWGALAPLYIRLLDLTEDDERRFVSGCSGGIAESFIATYQQNAAPKPTADPLGTLLTEDHVSLVTPTAVPFVAPNTENAVPKSVDEPFGTFTTIPGIYVAAPTAEPFVFANRENNVPVSPDGPIPTATTATGGGSYVVSPEAAPFVLGQQSDAAARDAGQPIPTVSTAGVVRVFSPTALPFLDVYYRTGAADGVDEPLSTATTKPRHALVAPQIVPYGPRAEARSGDEPLRTVTTEPRFGLAAPIAAVVTPGHGENTATGQLPRVHDLDDPAPTISASGHLHLATATVEAIRAAAGSIDPRRLVVIDGVLHVLDIRFRMLKNAELAAAMGFPPGYRFTGTKSDVTRQIGNAVCVNLAAALVGAILDPEGIADVDTRPMNRAQLTDAIKDIAGKVRNLKSSQNQQSTG